MEIPAVLCRFVRILALGLNLVRLTWMELRNLNLKLKLAGALMAL